MHPVNDPDRNCQVETTEKLIRLVDLLVLHVTRSSPGLKLSMTRMTDIPRRHMPTTPLDLISLRGGGRARSSSFTYSLKNAERRDRLVFINAWRRTGVLSIIALSPAHYNRSRKGWKNNQRMFRVKSSAQPVLATTPKNKTISECPPTGFAQAQRFATRSSSEPRSFGEQKHRY